MGFTICQIRRIHSPTVKNHLLCRPNIHNIRTKIKRNRRQQRIKRQYTPKSDDDPAYIELLKGIFLSAEFTSLSRLGFFYLHRHFAGCRSPPLVLHFQI